jgi:hypothetical protein
MAGQLADHVFFEPAHGIKFLWMALCCMDAKFFSEPDLRQVGFQSGLFLI